MARLKLLLAFLVLVVVVTEAVSAHRTTVTAVVVDDDENPVTICREQVRVRSLLHCRRYLSPGRQILEMRGGMEEPERRQQQLQGCCRQLRQMEEQCRCEGIRKVVKEQSQREKLQGRELRELVQRAEDLPSMCRVPPQRPCKMDVVREAGGY
ncbi:hypothetical protein MLD38_000528 [Melastoma candidum]|uniref:Uncharacterized protein n=1 Tax=Melastoma candidum TaxID=119954 RepID=A0ACB9SFA9_9MYRT|nr:hypothetical protein MLD38_000528 [Melastoma candidum]